VIEIIVLAQPHTPARLGKVKPARKAVVTILAALIHGTTLAETSPASSFQEFRVAARKPPLEVWTRGFL
jgi:hypothetical protein